MIDIKKIMCFKYSEEHPDVDAGSSNCSFCEWGSDCYYAKFPGLEQQHIPHNPCFTLLKVLLQCLINHFLGIVPTVERAVRFES